MEDSGAESTKAVVEKSEHDDSTAEDTEDEAIVTMMDVLREEDEQEASADAVLGGADDKICTYSEGYMKRQPLYACRTCCSDKRAGICLACSYKCHEGHDLIELYTKRNFRCDCGNSLFGDAKCNLDPIKDELNEKNQYNQNFSGVYCTCHRPYPDPEDEVSDVMGQCVVCEDWFHARHLITKEGEDSDLQGEFICHLCTEKFPFLVKCVHSNDVIPNGIATFLGEGWREKQCKCSGCLEQYEIHQVKYLLDEEDSVGSYLKRNEGKPRESQFERGMKALSSLGRVQQIEAVTAYNEMMNALKEHFQKLKEGNKVVSKEDIEEVFNGLQAKRRRVAVPPATCR